LEQIASREGIVVRNQGFLGDHIETNFDRFEDVQIDEIFVSNINILRQSVSF
jgi:hypothetical protein